MMSPKSISTRSAELDLLRVMAAFGVVIIHSSASLFYAYDHYSYWLGANAWDSVCRISVPLFFLLSGALILDPQKDPGSAWPKALFQRLLRLGIPLMVWSIIYAWGLHLQNNVAIHSQILNMVNTPISFHFSFIHDLMAVYIALPLLWIIHRAFLKDHKTAWYCFGLCLTSYIIAGLFPFALLQQIFLFPLIGYSVFFLLGGFLRHAKLNIRWWVGAALFAAGSSATFLLTWYFSRRTGIPSERFYTYLSFNVVIAAAGCFLMIPRFSLPTRVAGFLRMLSEATFFIYFVHVLVMKVIELSPLASYLNPTMLHPIMGIPLYALAVFLISFALSQACRIVPRHQLLFG